MKTALILLAIGSLALACSPAPSTAPASSAAPAAGDSFPKFVDDYFDARGLPIPLVRRILFRAPSAASR